MKQFYLWFTSLALFFTCMQQLRAQTSWKGTSSSSWGNSHNWTAGVPKSTIDAIIGDASFTGSFQPAITHSAACKSLTIGGGGRAVTVTVSRNLGVTGNLTINSNGTISHGKATITVAGNWSNSGTYTTTNTNSTMVFTGVAASLGGSTTTTFRKMTVNTGAVVTLAANATVSSALAVQGTLVPGTTIQYKMSTGTLAVSAGGILRVTAALFSSNYSGTVTLDPFSTVDYSATADQTINSTLTYGTLRISGSGTKSLTASLPALASSQAGFGNLTVAAGTLDLGVFTANRGSSVMGGTITVANGAILKIGGTNGFPANYATQHLALASTIQYSGTNQAIAATTYGNLALSSSSGAAVKTFPASAFIISGDLTTTIGTGTSVSFTAAAALTVSGNTSLGASTTFNGGSFSHSFSGNWTNNGTFNGNAGTVNFAGEGAVLSGTGTNNFNNVVFTASRITAAATTSLAIAGNISTTGPGNFTHLSGGTTTLLGTAKSISGGALAFDNLTITGTITTDTTFTVGGNLSVSGSLTASSGTVTMSGTSKSISGAGGMAFFSLQVSGTTTTASSFSVNASLNVSGSFTATGGTITFKGNSALNGTANLFNVTLNGTSLHLSANAVMGVASVFAITAGTLDVTTTIPNTVNFNGTGPQTVNSGTYYNLLLSNSNTKTAAGAITTNGDLTIAAGATFAAGSFTHTLNGNWVNNGTLTPGTGTITFAGSAGTYITGATTFNALTVNKTGTFTPVTIQNDVSAATVNMTSGELLTGSNTLNITTTRTGTGIILGNIRRTHAFTTGIAYAFESPDNTITFAAVSGVASITVSVTQASVSSFPYGSAVNRAYNVSVPSGTYTATLRLHYEDNELNGNTESSLTLWDFNSPTWANAGKTTANTTSNYVDLAGLTNLSLPWTLSAAPNVLQWTGAVSTDWNTAGNWTPIQGTPGAIPTVNDIAQIGTAALTNQPLITSTANARSLLFGGVQAATLSFGAGGSLTTAGNISGTWSSGVTHNINVGAQSLTVNGNFDLSDGVTGHAINLSLSTGTVTVGGSITETGGAGITFTGAGTLAIGGDFTYLSGAFIPGTGTVDFNGNGAKSIAGLTYNNLTVDKHGGIATFHDGVTVQGNLLVNAGILDLNLASSIAGNVTIAAAGTLVSEGITTTVGGNWTNNGIFTPGISTIQFNGSGAHAISASPFNSLVINGAGTATLAGNLSISGDLNVSAGTLDLGNFTANRASVGGHLALASGTQLLVGGAANFPSNYSDASLAVGSTVNYNGTVAQSVAGVGYGNLILNNSGAKTLMGTATVKGDITIGSGATVNAGINTISLAGNWNNSGTFVPGTGSVLLTGTSKTVNGNTTFNQVVVYGSYTVAGSDIIYNGLLNIAAGGSYEAGGGTATVNSDLINNGSLTSSGTTNFTGTTVQTIRLVNALISASTGTTNFNGTFAPNFRSTSPPVYSNVNVNNTGGVTPSIGWIILNNFTIASGASFNGGSYTHRISGNFTNNGTVSSSGTMLFNPTTPVAVNVGSAFASTGTVNFGGSGAITMTGTPTALQNVIIANTSSGGFTPASGWNISGNFSINSDAQFNAGSYSYTVGGNIESDGILNGGTSTFTMTSAAGDLLANPAATFYHFVVTGNVTASSDFQVAGNFTDNGTLDASIGQLTMVGATASIIGGSTDPLPIALVGIDKDYGVTVTPSKNLGSIASLHISGGILDAGSLTLGQDAVNGGDLTIEDSATLRIGGTNTLPIFSTYSFDTLSTVEYAGSTQSIPATIPYGNLTISTAGVKTPAAALTVLNNFTLSNGTFAGGAFTHLLGGDWTMTSGTFTNTGTTIQLNGVDTQTVSSTGAFSNLTVNKTTGLTSLGSDISVNGTLLMTSGKLSLLNNNLTLGAAATISGASATNYVIARGTGALVQPVTSGSSKAFPVGTAGAYIPATIALTPASTADNFAVRVIDTVYTNGTSGSAVPSGAVNATWMISESVAGGSTGTVTLQWPGSLELSGFIRSASRLAHFTAGGWDYGGTDLPATGSDPYSISRSGFTSFSPFAVSSFGALPVTWVDVNGNNIGPDNYVYWSTAVETNNDHFEIEISSDGISFTAIGKVSGTNHTSGIQQYSFVHHNAPAGKSYYRIKQVDLDGQASYSKVIVILANGGGIVSGFIYVTNPSHDHVMAFIRSSIQLKTNILIADAAGRVLLMNQITLAVGANRFEIPLGNTSAGLYYLQYIDEFGNSQTRKFIKQ